MTKLPNRKKLEEVMKYKMLEADRKNSKIAVLFFDLDKFKEINDEYGHSFGDKVLQEVAKKINSQIRKDDIVARIGGDEFAGLISGINSQDEIIEIAERMADVFKEKLNIDSKEIYIKPSIGISIYPDQGKEIEELILKADKAMYEVKENDIRYKIYQEKNKY